MHFSKTYTQLLMQLPPELRENSIQYRQLKKVINRIVGELTEMGLDPEVLGTLMVDSGAVGVSAPAPVSGVEEVGEDKSEEEKEGKEEEESEGKEEKEGKEEGKERQLLDLTGRRVVYELEEEVVDDVHGVLKPRLRIVDDLSGEDHDSDSSFDDPYSHSHSKLHSNSKGHVEVVIPLVHDGEFYRLLYEALMALQVYLQGVKEEFAERVGKVARDVGDSSGPSHLTCRKTNSNSKTKTKTKTKSDFHPFSAVESDVSNLRLRRTQVESDLYVWREVFRVYVEMEVFESVAERTRGERSVEEVEERMRKFVAFVEGGGGSAEGFRMEESRKAWKNFVALNAFVLDVKKLTYANTEATRKILKKHAKRTALNTSTSLSLVHHSSPHHSESDPLSSLLLPLTSAAGLPRMLVQAIGERLLVVIPHVDDYMCLICVELAFKPIRLGCGHLFCVRCLVKMQKGGKGRCPMCREESVLGANRTNVDWGLLNFMQDWFPVEAREKLKANEKEAAEEQMREMGLDPNGCVLM